MRLGAPVVSVVLDNRLYGTIRMHQQRQYPGRVVGTELTTPDLARLAEAFGARGFRAESEVEFAEALDAALAARAPAVIQVTTDPDLISVDGTRLSEVGRPKR